MIARLAAALVAALLLVACSDEPGRYDAQVDRVRSAVRSGDRQAALASLDELGTDAFQAHAAGEITDDELAALAALLEQARMQVDEEIPEATTTTTTTTAPPTTAPAPVHADSSEERDDDKKDKGKGRGDDDGDDDDDD